MKAVIINFVLFQLGWLACVLGGAYAMPWLGPVIVAGIVAYHLRQAPRPGPEIALLGIAAVIGTVWDSLLVSMGWLVYPSGTFVQGMAPYWIIAMWVLFATTFNVSMRWMKGRRLLAFVLGGIAGPLAYFGGSRLGGVEFAHLPEGLTALALGWAVLMPALMSLSNRFDGWSVARTAGATKIGGYARDVSS
jgi:hypothetical protein